jgi:PAS domain S-box-containing protein
VNEEQLLRLMLDQALDHTLILIDSRGRVIAWLMGSEKIFGYGADEMKGETIDRLFTPEDQERGVPANELEIAARFGRCEDDRWMQRKDGARFWAGGVVNCLRGADGALAGFSKVLRDRTDTRGQLDVLRNRADAFAEEDRRKTLALGRLAHDARNPLTVLANAAGMIERAHPGDPTLVHATQMIERQTGFLNRLFEDLLEVVRIRAGRVVLQADMIDLKEVIEAAIETAGADVQKKGQRIEAAFPTAPIVLEGDDMRLKQVFVNLLSNAARFSKAGGLISIKVTREDDEAVVRVEDRGRGIPPDLLPHIFELFTQGEAYEGASGLGMGLAIVKEYVELHGGTVQVRSEGQGQGAEFVVRLPLTRETVVPALTVPVK